MAGHWTSSNISKRKIKVNKKIKLVIEENKQTEDWSGVYVFGISLETQEILFDSHQDDVEMGKNYIDECFERLEPWTKYKGVNSVFFESLKIKANLWETYGIKKSNDFLVY